MSRRNQSRRRRSYAPRQRDLRRRQTTLEADQADYDGAWQSPHGDQRSVGDEGHEGAGR